MTSGNVFSYAQWPTFSLHCNLEFLRGLIANLYLISCWRIFVKTVLLLILVKSVTVSSYKGEIQDIGEIPAYVEPHRFAISVTTRRHQRPQT